MPSRPKIAAGVSGRRRAWLSLDAPHARRACYRRRIGPVPKQHHDDRIEDGDEEGARGQPTLNRPSRCSVGDRLAGRRALGVCGCLLLQQLVPLHGLGGDHARRWN